MIILIFFIILLGLVMIHEAGHFLAAKISGVRVEEFAFGFPPKLFSKKYGETNYVFNLLPIGGYVKIYGENGGDVKDSKSFVNKNAGIKIFILAAGVIMNFVLAYILMIVALYNSATFPVDENNLEYKKFLQEGRISERKIIILDILNNSPVQKAGIKVGDEIINVFFNKENSAGQIISQKIFDKSKNNLAQEISASLNADSWEKQFVNSVTVIYKNKNQISTSTLAGVYGLNNKTEDKKEDKKMLGFISTQIVQVNLTFLESFKLGIAKTNQFINLSFFGFKNLFVNFFSKGKIVEEISGPVGIVTMVVSAAELGLSHLLTFTAILSISLAILNILPFPALDGGRILFVIIEAITRRKISEKWQMISHGIGFAILILLMILVTVKDVLALLR